MALLNMMPQMIGQAGNVQPGQMDPMQFMPPNIPPNPGAMPPGAAPAPQSMGILDRLKASVQDPSFMARASVALNSLRHRPDPNLARAGQQTIATNEAKAEQQRQIQLEVAKANKTADWLETQPEGKQYAELIRQNPKLGGQILIEYQKAMLKPKPESFKQVRGADLGMTGEAANAIYNVSDTSGKVTSLGGQGGTSVNISTEGNIPAGYQRKVDENGVISMEPLPGTPDFIERQAALEKTERRGEIKAGKATTVVQDLRRAQTIMTADDLSGNDWGPAGDVAGANWRLAQSKIPGTKWYQMQKHIDSAKSNVGLDVLQDMRDNSPTGGALGQVPFQQQKRLEQVYGALEIDLPPRVLNDNLFRVQNVYKDYQFGTRQDRMRLVEEGKLSEADNRRIELEYHPLRFDRSGNMFDITNPPPDADIPPEVWDRQPEETKLRVWNRWDNNQQGGLF